MRKWKGGWQGRVEAENHYGGLRGAVRGLEMVAAVAMGGRVVLVGMRGQVRKEVVVAVVQGMRGR